MPTCPKCGTSFEVERWSRTKFKKGASALSRCNGCNAIITAYVPWYFEWSTYIAPLVGAYLTIEFFDSFPATISAIVLMVTWVALINPLFLPLLFRFFGQVKVGDHA
jgi:hypothetical protein